MNIVLSGCCGRMGRQVAEACGAQGLAVRFGVDLKADSGASFPVYDSFSSRKAEEGDVVIDFSLPSCLDGLLDFCVPSGTPLVIATTGYSQEDEAKILKASSRIAIFRSANMSLGVHVLKLLAKKAASLLDGFDIEIVEKHHNQKLDAPSGTALMLFDAVRKADSVLITDRTPFHRKRDAREIGISSVRGGTVPGEHEVGYYGRGEKILITHSAQDRSIFAAGAVKAAFFLDGIRNRPGLYSMDDMIQL